MLALTAATAAQAGLEVTCLDCVSIPEARTPELLARRDASSPLTLRWRSPSNPADSGKVVLLYAGDPRKEDALRERQPLQFTVGADGQWEATYRFEAHELGGETLLTVVTTRSVKDKRQDDGENEKILDWRASRPRTLDQLKRHAEPPEPPSGSSVTVAPALLRADTAARGPLPRFVGPPQQVVWWPLPKERREDVDLDGDATGIPGLSIQVSEPWHNDETNWLDELNTKFKNLAGHEVQLSDWKSLSVPDRKINLTDRLGPVYYLRTFYTVITLHTSATVASFKRSEVSDASVYINPFRGSPPYFAHETTARLKQPKDPRFWTSYSEHEFGRDQRLLGMLRRQFERESVPGTVAVHQVDGDGGTIVYSVGFYASVRPWAHQDRPATSFTAGLVGVDVVAARAGIGGVRTDGSGAGTPFYCGFIRCGQTGGELDLDKPPDGYTVAAPFAKLESLNGQLALLKDEPEIAERAVPQAVIPGARDLPASGRFGLSAQLAAGAILEQDWWDHVRRVVPVDSYAQFVVKLTVAMVPNTTLVNPTEGIFPTDPQLEAITNVPEKVTLVGLLKKFTAPFAVTLALVGLLALAIFVLPATWPVVAALRRIFRRTPSSSQ